MKDTQRDTRKQGTPAKLAEIGAEPGAVVKGCEGARVGEGGVVDAMGGPSSIMHQATGNLCSMAGPSLMDRIEQERSDWVPQPVKPEDTLAPLVVEDSEKKGAPDVDGALEHVGPVVASEKKAAAPVVKTRLVTAKALAEVLRFRQGPVIQAIEKNGGARDAQGVLWAAWEDMGAIGKALHLNLSAMSVMWSRAETWSKKLQDGLEMARVVQITGRNNVLECELIGTETRGKRTTAICRDVLMHEVQQEVVTRVGTFSREVWYGSI